MLSQRIKRKIREQLENYILKQKKIRNGKEEGMVYAIEEDLKSFIYFDLISMDDYEYLIKQLD